MSFVGLIGYDWNCVQMVCVFPKNRMGNNENAISWREESTLCCMSLLGNLASGAIFIKEVCRKMCFVCLILFTSVYIILVSGEFK